ncbi:DNA-directed RNA polymerase III subunit RPC5 [Gracilariopsis chorda]|uniref:DNA-directed RNA polymerase III subunit RPC5 n=1 Tax=Gracilariopsis chorda TaxID=448386 RepID=A0A2V3IGG2_9FLOR|nr:DNA-directed RNA polymerase III subunit RPC5 [Gracilariopsis chorda]|eukprot:PXF41142.1 DNA-directed RNA polymerase III subunit RPC5 [Gracilariopsis chorda]
MNANEDDPVVGEIDVFFRTPDQNNELHLMQYPLRHALSAIGSERKIHDVQLRPRHARIQMRLALYPESDDFTHTKSFNQNPILEKKIGQEQTLTSQAHLQPPQSNYTIGCFVPDTPSGPAFTIVPIRAVQQLRPTFSHIDDHDRQQLIARAERKGLLPSGTVEAPSAASPLTLSFRRRETERAAERRRNSYATLKQRERSDAWIPIQFAHRHRDDVLAKKQALFSAFDHIDVKDTLFERGTSYRDLFETHTRHMRAGFVAKAGGVRKEPLSAQQLHVLGTDAAVVQAMEQARIVRFAELHRLIGLHRPEDEVLSALRKAAYCVRGLWVVKKCGKDVGRKNASERYDACRMLLLDVFRRSNAVRTSDAIHTLGEPLLVSFASVLSILQEVGERQKGVGWQLRLVCDDKFVKEHEELCRTVDEDWERWVENARECLRKAVRRRR